MKDTPASLIIAEILHDGQADASLRACEYVYRHLVKEKLDRVEIDTNSAQKVLYDVFLATLNKGLLYNAGRLLWGNLFTIQPENINRLWNALQTEEKIGVIGGGGLGKTFTIIVKLFLDFHADPAYTTCKLISTTAAAGESNTWSQIVSLHNNSAIKLPSQANAEYYGLDSVEKRFGFERILIPKGESGAGRLRGRCHPFPRIGNIHPKFGTHSRARVFLDEAEAISEGVWKETGNVLNARDGTMRIQAVVASNPVFQNSLFAEEMEPSEGWDRARDENLKDWKSKKGWRVIRLDGADCENVKQKKTVYPGLMTFEGYNQHLVNGDPTAIYWSQARGIYPPQGMENSIIPIHLLNQSIGYFSFEGPTVNISAVDTALEGGDMCVHIFGRYGKAYGFQRPEGKFQKFDVSKDVIQVEQIVEYPKGDTLMQANRIIQACNAGGVHPRWLNLDRTGNGSGVHDVLLYLMSPLVMGTNYGDAATESKVMAEDTQSANEMYSGIVTELFYAARRWLEHGYIAFMPNLKSQRLFEECSKRNCRHIGGKIRVESKGDYKARMFDQRSPDHSDAFTLMVHLVRMNQQNPPEMVIGSTETMLERNDLPLLEAGPKDKLRFIDFS